jgi:hypothetical protein
MLMRSFHHLGLATQEIEAEKVFYLNLGYRVESNFTDEVMKVKGCFLVHSDFPRLEILENYNGNVLDPWLNRGSPFYHMGILCSKSEFEKLQVSGTKVFEHDFPVAFPGKKVTFVLYKGRRLIEYIYIN